MEYPNTWKEDRKLGRPRRLSGPRRQTRARLPSQTPTGGRGSPAADFKIAKRYAAVGARVGARFIPWVGLGILAVEVGWYVYNRQGVAGDIEPVAPPEGWTVGNLSCSTDDGFRKQYHQGNPFCIGPFAHVTIDGPWGMQVPAAKNELHLLRRRTDTTGHTVAWWQRSGSTDNTPRGGYAHPMAIPVSPITPWERFDPMAIPMEPTPAVHPDPNPVSPYPAPAVRNWRSPTEGRQTGPQPVRRQIIILFNPNDLPLRRPKPKKEKRKIPGWWRPALHIDILPEQEIRDPSPRPAPDLQPLPTVDIPPMRREPRPVRPTQRTPIRIDPLPVTQNPPAFTPGFHRPARPGPRVRERKARTRSPLGFVIVRALFEQVFETFDYVEAIYNSLPQNVRVWYERELNFGARDPLMQMQVIHRHYDLIDIPEMINNLIANEFEDFIFGLLGRISALSAQRLGLSVGPQFGQGFVRKQSQSVRRTLELQQMRKNLIRFVTDEVETFK